MEDRGTARRLASAYSALMDGVLYPGSEGDSPYEPFHAALAKDVELSPEALRSAAGIDSSWEIVLDDGEAWLDARIASARDPRAVDDPEAAVAYELLRRMMLATLIAPLHAGAALPSADGFQETSRYIFGRVESGSLAGLVAYSIET